MATAKKKTVVVRKKKEKKLERIDLSNCRLEVHPYPKNCGACVLAEFGGGHYKGHKIVPRALTWPEWRHILHISLFVQKSGSGGLGGSDILNFSERLDQAQGAHFSGLALFNMLLKHGCTGNITADSRYKFYSVVLTGDVRRQILDKKHQTPPESASKGVTFDPRWLAWEAGDYDEAEDEDEDDEDY